MQDRRFSNEPLHSTRPFLECSRLVVDVQRSPGAWGTATASGHKKIVEIGSAVSTRYRCHRRCHLQMSLRSGSGGGRARSHSVAQRPNRRPLYGRPNRFGYLTERAPPARLIEKRCLRSISVSDRRRRLGPASNYSRLPCEGGIFDQKNQ